MTAAGVSATFWGTLIVDPDQMFVSREAAEKSAQALRDFLSATQEGGIKMSRARPTTSLRFIYNSAGEKVLQQEWAMPYHYRDNYGDEAIDYDYEWRDVPIVPSPTCTVANTPV